MRVKERREPRLGWLYALAFALIAAVGILAYVCYKEHTSAPVSFFGAVGTVEDGGDIRIYVWTDPDSHKSYLITDRGGICERDLSVEEGDVPEVRAEDE